MFLISLIISQLYIGGDQFAYHNAYDVVSGLGFNDNLKDIRSIYYFRISANEWVHLIVLLFGGGMEIDKNLLMSIFNGIIASYFIRLWRSCGGDLRIGVGLVLTNYYFYVIYLAAERLKFAILFSIVSLLNFRKPLNFCISILLSIFSHFSIILIYSGILFTRLRENISNRNTLEYLIIIFSIIFCIFLFANNWVYIFSKLNTYYSISDKSLILVDLLKIGILLVFCCIYAKNKFEPILFFLPIIFLSIVLGGSRLNMFAYFIFLYFGVQFRGGLNSGMVILIFYFMYKTILFAGLIFKTGSGFV